MIGVLTRERPTGDGVFGQLQVGDLRLATCEDDWKDNRPRESCIPAGEYLCVRTIYRKHGYETFEVTGVEGRSRILIHPGNTEEDTEGCILVGLREGTFQVYDEDAPLGAGGALPRVTKRGVVASQDAFRKLMSALAGVDEFTLRVTWGAGAP